MSLETEVRKLYASIGKLITSSLELEDILEGVMNEVTKKRMNYFFLL